MLVVCVDLMLLALSVVTVSGDYSSLYIEDYNINTTPQHIIILNDTNTNGFLFDSRKDDYQSGMNCAVRFKAYPSNYKVMLKVIFIDIYKKVKGACPYDYLNIVGEGIDETICGRIPSNEVYTTGSDYSDYLEVKFKSKVDSPGGRLGFQIVYTRFHADTCSMNEFHCWNSIKRCIPAHLQCDGIDNCGDYSDERLCSSINNIGSIFLTCTIIISMLVMTVIVCTCLVRIILDHRQITHTGNIDRVIRNSNPAHPLPTVETGTVNPYNEAPPSYYAQFIKVEDEVSIIDRNSLPAYPCHDNLVFQVDDGGSSGDFNGGNSSGGGSDGDNGRSDKAGVDSLVFGIYRHGDGAQRNENIVENLCGSCFGDENSMFHENVENSIDQLNIASNCDESDFSGSSEIKKNDSSNKSCSITENYNENDDDEDNDVGNQKEENEVNERKNKIVNNNKINYEKDETNNKMNNKTVVFSNPAFELGEMNI